jgi:hypothetical protein
MPGRAVEQQALAGAGVSAAGSGGSAMAGSSGAGATTSGPDEPVGPACIPSLGCRQLCDSLGTDPSGCGVGNAQQCGCICEDRFNGPCPDELAAVLSCVGDAPSIDCDVRGRIFPGCERESLALEVCDFQAREQLCAQSYPLCSPYCEAATLSFCSQGPESVTSCLCGCEASLVTRCPDELATFMSCSSNAPQFSCDTSGLPVATACPAEWQALQGCFSPGSLGAPDAGP